MNKIQSRKAGHIRESVRRYFAANDNCATNQDFLEAYEGMFKRILEISQATKISEDDLVWFAAEVVSQMEEDNMWRE